MPAAEYGGSDGVEFEPHMQYDGAQEDDDGLERAPGLISGLDRFLSRGLSAGRDAGSVSSHGTHPSEASLHSESRRHSPYRETQEKLKQARAPSRSTAAAGGHRAAPAPVAAPAPTKLPVRRGSAEPAAVPPADGGGSGDSVQKQLADALKRCRELQREADVATRDKQIAMRQVEELEVKVSELELERLKGKGAGSGAGRGLEKRLQEAVQAREAATEALARESRALDESRSYVTALLNAMEGKGGGDATLLAEVRRLRAAVEGKSRDVSVRELATGKLEEQLRDAQARFDRLSERLRELQAGGGTTGRVAQLESEREALLDYLQERKAELAKANDTVAAQLHAREQADVECSRLRAALEGETEAHAAAQAAADTLRAQLEAVTRERDAAQGALKVADAEVVGLRTTVEVQARELEDTTAIQLELLNTVREHKRAADEASAHARSLEAELIATRSQLTAAQGLLSSRDVEATRVTAEVPPPPFVCVCLCV